MRKSLYDYCAERSLTAAGEWDSTKNAPLTPREISYGSRKKVWWRCEKGHEWLAAVYTRSGGSGCPYCAGRKIAAGENDLAATHPVLAGEWDFAKNAPLTPEQVSAGSPKRVWWLCEKGHGWRAGVKSRAAGAGCPYCTGRIPLPGQSDLATTHPELAAQWDAERNAPLTGADVTAGSGHKVWWLCERGHGWRAEVRSRTRGAGCPVCAGKVVLRQENDLASHFPDIAAQWHPTRNGALTPQSCAPASNRRVWWLCPEGHEYQAAVASRTVKGSGCPYCAGRRVLPGYNDLAALEPRIAAQWHPSLNGALGPDGVTVGSSRKVWWRCDEGHAWQAVVHSRTGARKSGCPVCAGTVKSRRRYRYAETEQLIPRPSTQT